MDFWEAQETQLYFQKASVIFLYNRRCYNMLETKMIHIRFPSGMADQMTTYLKSRGVNRNSFIVDAVAEKLRREMQAKSFKETQGALAPEDAPEWASSTGAEWVEKVRDKDRTVLPWDI
jgi:hypothetical protein